VAGPTNYMLRGTFEEPFSLCGPRAAITEKVRLHLQKEISMCHAAWRGWRPPPKAGSLWAGGSTLLHTGDRCLVGTSSCTMRCGAQPWEGSRTLLSVLVIWLLPVFSTILVDKLAAEDGVSKAGFSPSALGGCSKIAW